MKSNNRPNDPTELAISFIVALVFFATSAIAEKTIQTKLFDPGYLVGDCNYHSLNTTTPLRNDTSDSRGVRNGPTVSIQGDAYGFFQRFFCFVLVEPRLSRGKPILRQNIKQSPKITTRLPNPVRETTEHPDADAIESPDKP